MEVEVTGLNARQTRTLSVWEDHFQEVLQHEKNGLHTTKLQRLRNRGSKFLHSQPVLLFVVVLNCLDCLLVLSELFLDVYFVKGMITTAEQTMETFNQLLIDKYPTQFDGIPAYDTHKFYNKVLKARLVWDTDTTPAGAVCAGNRTVSAATSVGQFIDVMHTVFQDDDDPAFLDEREHSIEETIAHAFHKASITILGVLVLLTILKVFCHGLSFVQHKLEVFDGIVVVASFTLDVCYINGLTNYPVESFLLILAIMIPWRVIRVLNSLIIAVKDNFHFLMKLMFKKNKCLTDKLEYMETVNSRHQKMIQVLTTMCTNKGITHAQLANLYEEKVEASEVKAKSQPGRLLPIGACFRRQVSEGPAYTPAHLLEAEPLCVDTHLGIIQEVDALYSEPNEMPNDGKT